MNIFASALDLAMTVPALILLFPILFLRNHRLYATFP